MKDQQGICTKTYSLGGTGRPSPTVRTIGHILPDRYATE